jgi:hypothetical protein
MKNRIWNDSKMDWLKFQGQVAIEQHVIDTIAGKQLSKAATDV